MAKNNYKIKYLTSFSDELNGIVYYVTYILNNPIAAENLLVNVEKAIIDRSIKPEEYEKYKSSKNRQYTWYRIYVDNYTIFYTVEDNVMEIVHIFYGRRNLDKLI